MLVLGNSLISSSYRNRALVSETFSGDIANWTAVNTNIANPAQLQLAIQATASNGYAHMNVDCEPNVACSYTITATTVTDASPDDAQIIIGKTLGSDENTGTGGVDVTAVGTFTGTFTTESDQTKIYIVLLVNTNGQTWTWDNVIIKET